MAKRSTFPKKRGPKPIGAVPMTHAEHQRRYRERLRAGGAKDFLLTIAGLHLEHIQILAQAQGISSATALRLVAERALDQYVGVMRRSQRMQENGAGDEVVADFIRRYLFPELPPMEPDRHQAGGAK